MSINSENAEWIISKITEIRRINNESWMDMLKLAFKHAPKEAAEIMGVITYNDEKINALTKKLGELVNE